MKKFLFFCLIPAVLTGISMPGFGISFFALFSFGLFLPWLKNTSPIKSFFKGFLFGLIFFLVSFIWIVPTFVTEIPLVLNSFPAYTGIILYVLLCAIEAVFYGLFGFIFSIFQKKASKQMYLYILLVSLTLFLTEYLRSIGPMGFSGLTSADPFYENLIVLKIASIIGKEGIILLIGLINGFLAWLLITEKFTLSLLKKASPIIIVIFSLFFGDYFLEVISNVKDASESNFKIIAVQPDTPARNKYYNSEQEFIEDFEVIIDKVSKKIPNPDLIVFPEAFFMYDVRKYPFTSSKLIESAKNINSNIVVPHLGEEEGKYYNSVRIVNSTGLSEEFYGKRRLNPFTEFLPFEKILQVFGFLKLREYFTPGPSPTVFLINGLKVAFPICFESYYKEVFSDLRKEGAKLFVIVTNDGWFQNSTGLYQHFSQIPYRAAETGSYVMQVSNNGITGMADPSGKIVKSLDYLQPEIGFFSMAVQTENNFCFIDYYEIFTLVIFAFCFLLYLKLIMIK